MAARCSQCHENRLVSYESMRTRLCFVCRDKNRAGAEAPIQAEPSGHEVPVDEMTGRASALARHPAGKRGTALVESPCFFHSRPDKWTCPECVEIGERTHERIGSGFGEFI